jgi:hypothetical protein
MLDSNKNYKTRGDVYREIVPGRVVVEVGVFIGDNAKAILRSKPTYLYLMDTWLGKAASGDENGKNRQQANLPHIRKSLERELYGEPVTFLGPSPDGFKDIDIEPDFIYIDGDHTYPAVMRDLTHAYQLLKGRRTILGGHDYHKNTPGVRDAVDDFIKAYDLRRPILTTNDIPSYFIQL